MISVWFTGLKVTGGKHTEAGYLGAFITKVKKGSIADTVGHLRAGKVISNYRHFFHRCLNYEHTNE